MMYQNEDVRNARFMPTVTVSPNIDLPEVQRQRDRQELLDLSNAVNEKDAVIGRLGRWLSYIEENFADSQYFAKLALSGIELPSGLYHARA